MIAAESGFCDSSHLSRMFRRRFASTPHYFRASLESLGRSEGRKTPD
ncbi:helix-turn-helix domain-containing protein [Sinorhizobium sp. 8-89]|nr:helix-turn-helix domain-containing protein [Sinorhizobium sp. 7-81]MDK1388819.1 helix-turn-helix domain-containing protein [Sinorhizobium sp. 7-81]